MFDAGPDVLSNAVYGGAWAASSSKGQPSLLWKSRAVFQAHLEMAKIGTQTDNLDVANRMEGLIRSYRIIGEFHEPSLLAYHPGV